MSHHAPLAFSKVGHSHFVVGMDADGHWIARDRAGLVGGIFVSREAAIDFAEFETDHVPDAIEVMPRTVQLTLAGALPV
ncbi:hypothetical protein [Microvirga sp. CF3016]|uniref:hypothetical protein n=1 Tax=Microvirga sp. CF3016 TaxID=3110181 RepID=UPI002E7605CC|nr:hypothetical protein [Microvirga sp. CF3016]MEE1613676.1 hypothetical protein [Microvirga sp. CF3016]